MRADKNGNYPEKVNISLNKLDIQRSISAIWNSEKINLVIL